MKEGIFIGPQIRDIIKDEYFDNLFQGDEKPAWTVLNLQLQNFWETEGSKLRGACKQPFAEPPEIRLQHVTKNTLP